MAVEKNNNAEKETTSEKISKAYREAVNYQTRKRTRWRMFYAQFRSHSGRRYDPDAWGDMVFIPMTMRTVLSYVSRLSQAVPVPLVKPSKRKSDLKTAINHQMILDFWGRQANINIVSVDEYTSVNIWGTVIGKIPYKLDVRSYRFPKTEEKEVEETIVGEDGEEETVKRLKLVEVYDENKKPVYDKKDVIVNRGGSVEILPIEDALIDPRATDIDSARYVIHRVLWHKDKAIEYKNQFAPHITDKQVLATIAEGDTTNWQWYKEEIDLYYRDRAGHLRYPGETVFSGNSNGQQVGNEKTKDMIEVLEYWEDDQLAVRFGNDLMIRDEPNPYDIKKKPFTMHRGIRLPNELYGMGLCEILEQLQYARNTNVNEIMKNTIMMVNKMFLVDSKAQIDENDLEIQPFGIIKVRAIGKSVRDAVVPLEFGTNNMDPAFRIDNLLNVEEERAGGATDPRGSSSATEASFIADTGDARIDAIGNGFEQEFLQRLYMFWSSYIKQFTQGRTEFRVVDQGQDKFVLVLGDDIEITPEEQAAYLEAGDYDEVITYEELLGDVEVIVEPGSALPKNKEAFRQQWLQLFNLTFKAFDEESLAKMTEGQRELTKKLMYWFDAPGMERHLDKPAEPEVPEIPEEGLPPDAGAGLIEQEGAIPTGGPILSPSDIPAPTGLQGIQSLNQATF